MISLYSFNKNNTLCLRTWFNQTRKLVIVECYCWTLLNIFSPLWQDPVPWGANSEKVGREETERGGEGPGGAGERIPVGSTQGKGIYILRGESEKVTSVSIFPSI